MLKFLGIEPTKPKSTNRRVISDGELTSFQQNGFIIFQSVVPPGSVISALRVINRSIGRTPPIREQQCPDLRDSVEIAGLMIHVNEQILPSLLGYSPPIHGGQIALRYPGDNCDDSFRPYPNWHQHWHIDGLASAHNAHTPYGTIDNFTLLIGVALQDHLAPDCGNLVVYPGSHVEISNYLNVHGFDSIKSRGDVALKDISLSSALGGPAQILMHAGDVVIANYLLAHLIAPNTSANIRYMVYFRIKAREFRGERFRPESMLNPWIDVPAVRNLIRQNDDDSNLELALKKSMEDF